MQLVSDLKVTVSEVQGRVPITVFEVDGRINLSNAAKLEEMAREYHARGMHFLLLDLSAVSSITSAGLRAVHLIFRMLEQPASGTEAAADGPAKSRHLKLVIPPSQVLTVFQTAGFDINLDIYPTRREAIDAF